MSTEPSHSPLRLRKRTVIDLIAIGISFAIVLAIVLGMTEQRQVVAKAKPSPILINYTNRN